MELKNTISSFKNLIKHKIKKTRLFNRYLGVEKKYQTYGTLSDEQMRYIYAFSSVIYHPSDKKERMQLRKIISKWTKGRTEIDGYFKEYNDFIKIIKSQTSKKYADDKFYDLSSSEITELLNNLYHKSGHYTISRTSNPITLFQIMVHFMINRKAYYQNFILKTVKKDLINGIFTSKLVYSLVGYNSMPGVPGKHPDYTEPPKLN